MNRAEIDRRLRWDNENLSRTVGARQSPAYCRAVLDEMRHRETASDSVSQTAITIGAVVANTLLGG